MVGTEHPSPHSDLTGFPFPSFPGDGHADAGRSGAGSRVVLPDWSDPLSVGPAGSLGLVTLSCFQSDGHLRAYRGEPAPGQPRKGSLPRRGPAG